MQFKPPKDSDKYKWTKHAIYKLRQYGLSSQRIVRVINNPQRKEEGIVPRTIAVMQPASLKNKSGKKTWSQEIWAMYIFAMNKKDKNKKFKAKNNTKYKIPDTRYKIISAWRYPGVSPLKNPVPDEILREISHII